MIRVKVPIGKNEFGSIKFYQSEVEWSPGEPILYYVRKEFDGVKLNRVIWNGKSIPEQPMEKLLTLPECDDYAVFDSVIPTDNDELIIVPSLEDPIATPSFIIAAAAYVGISAGTVIAIGNMMIAMAVSMALSTLVSFLTAPAKPKGQAMKDSPTSYGWQGIQNSYGPGDPIPVVFGTHRCAVKVVHYSIEEEYVLKNARKMTYDLSRTKMYMNFLGVLGHGEVDSITGIQINGNPIENYGTEVVTSVRYGTQSQTAIDGFDEDKTSYETGVVVLDTPMWEASQNYEIGDYVICTDQTASAYAFVFECTDAGTTGGTEPVWPLIPNDTVVDGGAIWKCVGIVGGDDGKRYIYTTSEGVTISSYQVHFEAPGGIYNSTTGGIEDNTIKIRVEDRAYGTTEWTDRGDGDFTVKSNKTGTSRWSVRVDLPIADYGRRDIRVTKTFIDHPTTGQYAVQVGSVTEIQKQADPHTYSGYAVIGIRALATAHLSQSPPTVTALVRGVKVPVYDSVAMTWNTEWSDNPAFISREVCLNTTWGFGNWFPDTGIDSDTVVSAAEYCQPTGGDKKHTCNFVWDQRRALFPLLDDILGPARVMKYRGGGKLCFVAQQAKSSSQLFTMGNIVEDSLSLEWVDERLNYNALDVSFISADKNYQNYAFRADLGITPVKPKNITFLGVTDGDEAVRDATYHLNVANYIHEAVSFQAGIDAIACMPGDVFSFAHDTAKYGLASGRAGADSVAANQVYLDESVTLVAGKTYNIIVRFSGGGNPDVIQTRVVSNAPGTYTSITTTVPFGQTVQKGDLYAIGEAGSVVKEYVLVELNRKTNQNIELRGLEYNVLVFTDDGTLPADTNDYDIDHPDRPPNSLKGVDITEEAQIQDDLTYVYNLIVSWDRPVDTTSMGEYLGANIYYAFVDVTAVLGDFGAAEGWAGGAENTTFGEYKSSPSWKVPSTNEVWAYTERVLGASVDYSSNDYIYVGSWAFVDNIRNLYNGQCIQVQIKTDDSNYFYSYVSRSVLSGGFNYIFIHKDDFSEQGAPDWSNINKYKLGCKAAASVTVNVSFDEFNYFPNFSWQRKTGVDGTFYRWENIQQGITLLLKLNSYSVAHIESPTPAYGCVITSPYDTVAPAVPVWSATPLVAQGQTITASVVPNSEDDFAGYEWHFKKTGIEFTPDATTLYKKGNSSTCTYIVPSTGEWSVKVLAYDYSGNPLVPVAGDYCAKESITVTGIMVDDITAPTPNPPTGMGYSSDLYIVGNIWHGRVTLSWNVCTDADSPPVEYEVELWKGAEITKLRTYKTQELTLLITDLELATAYHWKVRAGDQQGNYTSFCADQDFTSANDVTRPGPPTGLGGNASFHNIFLWWTNPVDADFDHVEIYRYTSNNRGAATLRAKVWGTDYIDYIGTYPTSMWYWVKAIDSSGLGSATEAGPYTTTTGTITATDISSFAITASKIFTKIPILDGDSWTDNSPSAGYVAWNAHTLYYNGVAYSISASNTNLKYIYWLAGASSYTKSNTNPTLTDGDFVIAVNISGAHDLAWNAIANEVIGSAYIQNAAIINAKIYDCCVDKLTTGTIIAQQITMAAGAADTVIKCGKTSFVDTTNGYIFGTDHADGDKVKFVFGNATYSITWNASTLAIVGSVTATAGYIGGPTGWAITTGKLTSTGIGMATAAGDATYAFWAGDDDPANAEFSVTHAGLVKCANINVTGGVVGGFTPHPTDGIYVGDEATRVQMKPGVGFFCGDNTFADAPFSVTCAGVLKSVSGTIGSWTLGTYTLTCDSGATGLNSEVTAGTDWRIWAGHATPGSAAFRVDESGNLVASSATITGEITANSGEVGGFTVDSTDGLYSGSDVTHIHMQAGVGFWAGADTQVAAPFSVTQAGVLKATSATITGTINANAGTFSSTVEVGTDTPHIHIVGTPPKIVSSDYSTGVCGFILSPGLVEAGNAIIRGELRTTVLVYQEKLVTGGTLVVAKGGGRLKSNVTTVASPTTFNVDIEDPPSGHLQMFTTGDILYLRNSTLGNWVTVSSVSDQTTFYRYVCTLSYGTPSTFYAGSGVIDYGQTGQGYLEMSADQQYAPWYSVRTHAGSPWAASTELARFGNLQGGWGYVSAIYGIAFGKYDAGFPLIPNITIDPTNGIRFRKYNVDKITINTSGDLTITGGSIYASGFVSQAAGSTSRRIEMTATVDNSDQLTVYDISNRIICTIGDYAVSGYTVIGFFDGLESQAGLWAQAQTQPGIYALSFEKPGVLAYGAPGIQGEWVEDAATDKKCGVAGLRQAVMPTSVDCGVLGKTAPQGTEISYGVYGVLAGTSTGAGAGVCAESTYNGLTGPGLRARNSLVYGIGGIFTGGTWGAELVLTAIGSAAPTHSCSMGSVRVGASGAGVAGRLYVNYDGSTTWKKVAYSDDAPYAHYLSHQNGGSDEISVAGLSGVLADAQNAIAHHTNHETGGSDVVTGIARMKVGTYAGSHVAHDVNIGINLSTATYAMVIVKNVTNGAERSWVRTSSQVGDQSFALDSTTNAYYADRITGFTTTGFSVGTDNSVNDDGDTFLYIVFYQT